VVDYLVSQTGAEQVGHVRARGLADVTPFTDGEPRHPIRLHSLPDRNVTVLTGEVFLPTVAGEPFVEGIVEWATGVGIWEFVAPYAVPYRHGPEEHRTFHVGTAAFRERRLAGHDVDPLRGGFLDGPIGELLTAGLDRDAPVGVLLTPTHPPGPDLDAAVRVLETLEELYDLGVDVTELRSRAEERQRHYAELADHVQSLDDRTDGREYPEDRMFM
jgi:uncharacterized protein